MSTLKRQDGEASERELLVDDIQRIREVLHISGVTDKISSDEEADDGSEEDEEDEDEPQKRGESLTGLHSDVCCAQNLKTFMQICMCPAAAGPDQQIEFVNFLMMFSFLSIIYACFYSMYEITTFSKISRHR